MPRTLIAGAALAAVALAAPALATANVTAPVCTPDGRITATLTGWAQPANLADVSLTVDGTTIRSGPLGFPGPDTTVTYPLTWSGAHTATVSARTTPTSRVYSASAVVNCPPPRRRPR